MKEKGGKKECLFTPCPPNSRQLRNLEKRKKGAIVEGKRSSKQKKKKIWGRRDELRKKLCREDGSTGRGLKKGEESSKRPRTYSTPVLQSLGKKSRGSSQWPMGGKRELGEAGTNCDAKGGGPEQGTRTYGGEGPRKGWKVRGIA